MSTSKVSSKSVDEIVGKARGRASLVYCEENKGGVTGYIIFNSDERESLSEQAILNLPELLERLRAAPSKAIHVGTADRKQKRGARLKLREQEEVILDELKRRGYDPKRLPRNPSGKRGVKYEIRTALKDNVLFAGVTVFDWAWDRLRKDGAIANVK